MISAIVLASCLLGQAMASFPLGRASTSFPGGLQTLIIKLDTHGYPLWVMDKAHAPILHSESADYYWETQRPSAVLLNFTMSHDNKTLLLNHKAILPLENDNVPPSIEAYQVPADITTPQTEQLVAEGLLNRKWEGLTLGYRYLALDYDRLVWADPEAGPYQNHEPTLQFRIMGIGAHSRSDELAPQWQNVVQVRLRDQNHGSSDAPDRSYVITDLGYENMGDSYKFAPSRELEQAECTLWSWKCADRGLYQDTGKPAYRFIWRSRFDQYGRIGSLRHAVFRKMDVLKRIWEDAGSTMMMSFSIVMLPSLLVWAVIAYMRKQRRGLIRTSDAFDDRLLG
ncbi:hypothetical protein K505DRAFT_330688, partial [Melanomma pulvis-pyrius CBS 109.77]